MKKNTALVFPGQGAQCVGMASDFYSSELCQQANDLCGFDLVGTMRDGPEENLKSTRYCQPALFLHSALVLEELEKRGEKTQADFYLGLSLGEFTSLYAAGVLGFADVIKILLVRGGAMDEACRSTSGGMLTVLHLEDEKVKEVCDAARGEDVLQAANFNCPGQVVVSGDLVALARAEPLLKEAGARRVLPLKVAGAFHSALMQSGQAHLRECLEKVTFKPGAEKVISNRTGRPHQGEELLNNLVEQMVSPVKWGESIQYLLDEKNISSFVELGTGRVLSGLIKKIRREVETHYAGNSSEVEALISS